MTMDIAEEHVKYIATTLESHVLTYHTAARDLGIHVSKSKVMLSSYYQANKTRVAASFIATGTRQGNINVRVFESEADFTENWKLSFDDVTTLHVYSLSLATNSFTTVEIAMEEGKQLTDLADLAKYHKLGLIQGPALEISQVKSGSPDAKASLTSRSQPQLKTVEKPEKKPASSTSTEKEKPKLVYQSRKQQPKPSIMSSYVSRKGEKNSNTAAPSVAQKRESSEKPSYEYKSRKLDKSQPKERVVVSNVNDEDGAADEPMEEPAATKSTVTESELHNLFLDDFTDEDEKADDAQPMEIDQPIVVGNTENDDMEDVEAEAGAETRAEPPQESPEPRSDIWKTMSSSKPASETPTTAQTEPQTEPLPETSIDEDGYFTSYKQSEPKSEPAKRQPKPQAAISKPTKKTDGKKKQASVMSFFSKR